MLRNSALKSVNTIKRRGKIQQMSNLVLYNSNKYGQLLSITSAIRHPSVKKLCLFVYNIEAILFYVIRL